MLRKEDLRPNEPLATAYYMKDELRRLCEQPDKYDYPISTGPLEGTNSKIRVVQHQACGFRDTAFFKLKRYALH